MKVCYALLGTVVLGAAVPGTQPDAHDAEWVEAPRRVLQQMKAGHLHHSHQHPQHKHASLLAEHSEAPRHVAAKHTAATMTPNAHDADWVEAPRHVLQEMKAGHLHHFHAHPQHRRASLLAENAAASEGTMTGKILGDIGSAEDALEHALRGAPSILEKEEGLLKKASLMATQAGRFQAQERSLTNRMNMHAAKLLAKSEKRMSKAESNAMLNDVGRKETALIADGFGILRETKNLKVDVVDAIGESNPMMAAKVEHFLDSVGLDQKKIMRGEARLAHGVKQSLMGERAQLRHKTMSSLEGLAQAARDEEKLANGGASVLKSAETIKGEVSHLLGSDQVSEVSRLMDQVEHIQHRVNDEDHESAKLALEDVHSMRAMARVFKRAAGRIHV